jgi:hypothetical protein
VCALHLSAHQAFSVNASARMTCVMRQRVFATAMPTASSLAPRIIRLRFLFQRRGMSFKGSLCGELDILTRVILSDYRVDVCDGSSVN